MSKEDQDAAQRGVEAICRSQGVDKLFVNQDELKIVQELGMKKRTINAQLFFETELTDEQMGEILKEATWKLTRDCKGRMVVTAALVSDESAQLVWDSAELGPEPKPGAKEWRPKS